MKITTIVLVCFAMLAGQQALGEEVIRKARIVDLSGDVSVRSRDGDGKFAEAFLGDEITQGDLIKTGPDSSALLFIEGKETAQVEVYENSQLLLLELLMDTETGRQATLLDLALGKVMVKSKKIENKDSMFEVKTPTTVVGVMDEMESSFSVEVESLE